MYTTLRISVAPCFQEIFKRSMPFFVLMFNFQFSVENVAANERKLFGGEPSSMCSTVSYIDKHGNPQQGTRNCSAAIQKCTKNLEKNCMATLKFKAIDSESIDPSVIRAGVQIGNKLGTYPSALSTLEGGDATADLAGDYTTRESQWRGSSDIEFFQSDGTRVVMNGDADLIESHIKSGIEILGVSGSSTGVQVDPWSLRAGITINGISGKLQVNCRSPANLSDFDQSSKPKSASLNPSTDLVTINSHGWSNGQKLRLLYATQPAGLTSTTSYFVINQTTNTFQISLTNGGSAVNFTSAGTNSYFYGVEDGIVQDWDSSVTMITFGTSLPSSWSLTEHYCGGVAANQSDSAVWLDITTTGDGVTPSTCLTTPSHCTILDKISRLEWHRGNATDLNWFQAYDYCNSTIDGHNGKSDWRLPTQKEGIEASLHGMISSTGISGWYSVADFTFPHYWTSTTISDLQNSGIRFSLADWNYNVMKVFGFVSSRAICVRP